MTALEKLESVRAAFEDAALAYADAVREYLALAKIGEDMP
jgi:hypothetical protein